MSVPVVTTIHNYKLACASGDFFRREPLCHDCDHGLPWPALRHGCYRVRGSPPLPWPWPERSPSSLKSMVAAYIFILPRSATC
jgi:hypothetical protein